MIRCQIDWRRRWPQLAAGLLLTLPLMFGIATLSGAPQWRSLPADSGLVRLSFTHSGARSCRDRSEAELAALPKNMRASQLCERRRSPVRIEMDVDGRLLLAQDLKPSGIAGSGPSRIYRRLTLPAGRHMVELRMNDDPSAGGFTSTGRFELDLAPGQGVAIDFDPLKGGFFLH